MRNRRRHFLVDKPLQFRYMAWLLLFLVVTTLTVIVALHDGIWAKSLEEFSSESIRNALRMASRIQDYQMARFPGEEATPPRLVYVKETDLFSKRQLEIIADILGKTRERTLSLWLALLFFLAWSTIYLSHKIAGPLYRFKQSFRSLAARDLTVRAHLRKYDEAQGIADIFNEAMNELETSVGKMKKSVSDSRSLEELRRDLSEELARFKTTGG